MILGCMSYGTPEWQKWVLGEEEGIAQIKFACVVMHHQIQAEAPLADYFDAAGTISARHSYENGIQTFDTANVSLAPPHPLTDCCGPN
jgi:hypothetical protein